jgi:hypothetical protein
VHASAPLHPPPHMHVQGLQGKGHAHVQPDSNNVGTNAPGKRNSSGGTHFSHSGGCNDNHNNAHSNPSSGAAALLARAMGGQLLDMPAAGENLSCEWLV